MEHLRILFEYLFYFEFYCPLTHFMSRSLSIPPENLYPSGFLFSGGIEKDQCYETDQQISVAFILSQSNNKSSYFQSKKMFYPQLILFFWWIHKLQNLQRRLWHEFILEVTSSIVSLKS